MKTIELLSPAGSAEAGYAALEYGADAVYLGLPRFSARAGADNFSVDELRPFCNYAHQLERRRSVYAAVNTLVQEWEIPKLLDNLIVLDEIGVDAVIVQDLGVARLLREHFPDLSIHASTQMAIHSRAGAEAAKACGISRAVLARELTLDEIKHVSGVDGLETEVFIHGALCYGYSGLCLMSSHFRHLSGNRGKCTYTCRESFDIGTKSAGFVLSMKDLALPNHLYTLREAGVASVKIEGRKKSPAYVAAVTHYYRQLLDGALTEEERAALESDIRTIFSRPQTELFASTRSAKGSVRSTDVSTHQGSLTGTVEGFIKGRGVADRLVVKLTDRPLEKHDGLRVEIPGDPVPFGFAAKAIWAKDKFQEGRSLLRAETGETVEIELPSPHPRIPVGTDVYCTLAGVVKTRFKTTLPRVDSYIGHIAATIRTTVAETGVSAELTATVHGGTVVVGASESIEEGLEPARRDLTESARRAFEKLGGSPFVLQSFILENPQNLYVPQALFNTLRRKLLINAATALEERREARRDAIFSSRQDTSEPADVSKEQWIIAVDDPSYLDAFAENDLSRLSEIILYINGMAHSDIDAFIRRYSKICPVRLGFPAITREYEEPRLLENVKQFLAAGIRHWALSNLSGITYLAECWNELDVVADWPLYVLNSFSADELVAHGFSGVTLSPEDTGENLRMLLSAHPRATIPVFQDTPLAISEACVMATDSCRQEACDFRETKLVSRRNSMLAINHNCRTILINDVPYSLCGHINDLRSNGARHFRTDFIWRDYTPESVHRIWQQMRMGTYAEPTHAGSYGKRI